MLYSFLVLVVQTALVMHMRLLLGQINSNSCNLANQQLNFSTVRD